jgi:uncharacterized iron-regulated membrane protein
MFLTIWRWHFYASLFVIPFILILSVTGSIYLFKPQLDRWQESGMHGQSGGVAVNANAQLSAVLSAYPGAQFRHYRLPEKPSDAAVIHIGMPDGKSMRDIYVSPQGKILAAVDPGSRISAFVARIHGSLLLGKVGSYLVELAASWAVVMIITGLYLWWPLGGGLAGVVWPRIRQGGRRFWRDIHAVTGFWIAGLALVTLASGLPWTDGWGTAFKFVRAEMGWVDTKPQDWKNGADTHAAHDHAAMLKEGSSTKELPAVRGISLAVIAEKARAEAMPFPAIIIAPSAPMRFGPANGADWKLTSETQNRPLVRTVTYNAQTGAETSRTGFADKHVADRIVNYGIAWHEGQLFGWINQLIGLITASGLIMLTVSGFIMWRRRKPDNMLGAPPHLAIPARIGGVAIIIVLLAALLPLLALSVICIMIFDRLILPFTPRFSAWLGN